MLLFGAGPFRHDWRQWSEKPVAGLVSISGREVFGPELDEMPVVERVQFLSRLCLQERVTMVWYRTVPDPLSNCRGRLLNDRRYGTLEVVRYIHRNNDR